jgi:hypothetical protein
MLCQRCGSELVEEATFCHRCGAQVATVTSTSTGREGTGGRSSTRGVSSYGFPPVKETPTVVAPSGVVSLRCPSCGAGISPRFGEMIITCEYCGTGVTLGSEGWKNIQKHTMLPLKVSDKEAVLSTIHAQMNSGIFRWHIWERSVLEEITLSYVPYWIISVSARTSIVAVDTGAQIANVAAAAAIAGAAMGASQHGHGGRGNALNAAILGSMVVGNMGHSGGGSAGRAHQMNENHNYPVVALRALTEYQPHDIEFALQERQLFDIKKIPKGMRVLNGDVGEQDAKQQARTLVDQLQSQKARQKYSMIQQLKTEIDVGEAELLHVPAWFASYLFKEKKRIVVIVDGNSGETIHTVGIDD